MTKEPVDMGANWRPIETAPKDGRRVILWNSDFTAPITGQWYGKDWRISYDTAPFKHHPTHWMPLPPPPAPPAERCPCHEGEVE